MQTIGIIGGTSWESTVTYYQIINEKIKEELGGLSSGKILLYSVNFAEVEKHMAKEEWDEVAGILSDAAIRLEKGGADFIILATNTLHIVCDKIQEKVSIPMIHIGDVTAEALKSRGMKKAALLGTRFTMQKDFMKERLRNNGIEIIVPSDEEMKKIDSIIFNELCLGIINEDSRNYYLDVISRLKSYGAECVILGCTEIGMLVNEGNSPLPVFDTAIIHPESAVRIALK